MDKDVLHPLLTAHFPETAPNWGQSQVPETPCRWWVEGIQLLDPHLPPRGLQQQEAGSGTAAGR